MPARVQCIYERALAKFPVTHALWLQYALYLEQHLNIPAVVNQVYARAVRNCPWVGALWSRHACLPLTLYPYPVECLRLHDGQVVHVTGVCAGPCGRWSAEAPPTRSTRPCMPPRW